MRTNMKQWLALLLAALCLCLGAALAENTLVLPDDLVEIGEGAFRDVGAIDEVVLPEGITTIGEWAFAGDTIGAINLPASLVSIADNAFDGPVAVEVSAEYGTYAYDWAADNGYIEGLDDVLELSIESGRATITKYNGTATELVIPNTLQGATVVGVAAEAFQGCETLRKIELPSSVRSLPNKAFNGCTALETYRGPLVWDPNGGKDSPFYGAYRLKRIEITGTVTAVPDYAFALSSTIVTTGGIRERAFYGELEQVTLPNSVRTIGEYAFKDLETLADIDLPANLQSIGGHAFTGCKALTEIEVPAGVTSLGVNCFYGCDALEHYTGPLAWTGTGADSPFLRAYNLKRMDIVGNLEAVPDYAFARSDSYDTVTGLYVCFDALEAVTLPDTVTTIGEGAFRNLVHLAQMSLPGQVTGIGDQAFYGCEALTSPAFPDGLETIGVSAFERCAAIAEIDLPDTVTAIGDNAFAYCDALTDYTGPFAWTIGADTANPFYRSFDLARVEIIGDLTTLEDNAFYHDSLESRDDDVKRYVCYNALEEIVLPDSVTTIGEQAFYNCKALRTIRMPNALTIIGAHAFFYCESLEAIELPNTVLDIGDKAFERCASLALYKGPIAWDTGSNVTTSPFYNAPALRRIELTEGVTEVPAYAFKTSNSYFPSTGQSAYYGAIEEVVLPGTVRSIGAYAFANTREKSLRRIYIPASVTSIASTAFSGVQSTMTMYGEANSYAQKFAITNQVTFAEGQLP